MFNTLKILMGLGGTFATYCSFAETETHMQTELPQVIYTLSINSYKTDCMVYVNGVSAMRLKDRGPMNVGLTVSAYLENGKNILSVRLAPPGANEHYEMDAYCKANITARTQHDEFEVVSIYGTPDKNLKNATGKASIDYEGNNEHSPIKQSVFGDFAQLDREFIAKDLPDWAWTTAQPFTETAENIAKLRAAYEDMRDLMAKKDREGIKKRMKLASSEEIWSQGFGYNPDIMYESLDFDEKLSLSSGVLDLNWDDYQIDTINNGRLIRMFHRERGNSPLRLKNSEGNFLWAYNPRFSLINGKMVITR